MDRLRPIGCVVAICDSDSKILIVGYYPKSKDKEYHYLGVNWPFGYSVDKKFVLFDEKSIIDVLFNGFDTPDSQKFLSLFPLIKDAADY